MIFGLTAALGWGVADFGAAVVARRVGSMTTAVISQVAGILTLLVLVAALRPAWSTPPGVIAGMAANGAIAAGAYLLLYRGLELGPVALVSPVVAAYAVITIALAVAFLGESLPGIVAIGAFTTVVGVVLTSTDLRKLGRPSPTGRSGLRYAIASMALFGVATFLLGRYAKEVGWLPALTLSRAFSMASLVGVAMFVAGARPLRGDGPVIPAMAGATLVGVIDVLGGAAYARGTELGYVSIVSAASATFPLIPVVGGI
ncbi:MAG TPA: DMT family transporter, partial [Actinomycetota bacterium]|nr:DMT family transporter [Actinomycetota bacterium]